MITSVQIAERGDGSPELELAQGEIERFAIELHRAPLLERAIRSGDEVRVALPTDERSYRVTRVSEHVPGTLSISAMADDGSHDVFAVTITDSGVVGLITSDHDLFHLTGDLNKTVLKRMDPHEVDEIECGIDHDHEAARGEAPGAGRAVLDQAIGTLNLRGLSETLYDPITIDLMVMYTANAESWAAAPGRPGIEGVISQAMNLSTLALDNSEMYIDLRVVHTALTDYSESTPPPPGQGASSWHLRRLTASSTYNPWGPDAAGYMLEVHDLREEYGADLVTLFAEISDVGGIAWVLNTIGGRPELGFSVNRVQQMSTSYTLVHEIGHNMGSRHGRDQASSASPPAGGVFEYATGWRFAGDTGNWNTVMSYGRGGDVRIPYFSNPDVLYDGAPTGEMFGLYAPANNGRAFREVKRVVASYQPSMVDPPDASVTATGLEVELPAESSATRSIQIGNSGQSGLVWDMDFVSTSTQARGMDYGAFSGADVENDADDVAPTGSVSPTDYAGMDEEIVIYETTFDPDEGFTPGAHHSIGGWSGAQVAGRVRVTSDNPSTGSQHIRFPGTVPLGETTNMYSTYFGPWPSGAYSMSFDFSITQDGGSTYFILLQDSRSGNVVGGLRLSGDNQIGTYDTGGIAIPGEEWVAGEYRNATIEIDPMMNEILYFLDGEHVATRPAPYGPGASIGRFWIQRSTASGTDQLDLDNIQYSSEYRGLKWLRAERMGGVVPAGSEHSYGIEFVAYDLGLGDYTAEIVLTTNDPDLPILTIPVSMQVTPVSGEGGPGDVAATRLVGHYPNPVSSTARIQFELSSSQEIMLEVFSVTGRRVLLAAEGVHSAGSHEVNVDVSGLANGIYLYRLSSATHAESGRMAVVR